MKKPHTLQKPKRLTPKPDVVRALYLLSGNNCAMPGCGNAIIDRAGVIVGQICHIEAALPDGARFNAKMNNEQRRAQSNLVLICAGHHLQIDSPLHAKKWTLSAVRKLKADHERKFQAIDDSLIRTFESGFTDLTDNLDPTDPGNFAALERHVPDCAVTAVEAKERSKAVNALIEKLRVTPATEREFVLWLIRRAVKLGGRSDIPIVHVDDVQDTMNVSAQKLQKLGSGLQRYDIGGIEEFGTRGDRDEYHVFVSNPSDLLTWFDIAKFCEKSGCDLRAIVVDLKFGLLAGP